MFLHNCANAIWNLKGLKSPPLSILVFFFQQIISITLQRLQTSSILCRTVVVSLTISWFPPFYDTFPISMTDLLQVANFGYGKIQPTYYKWLIFDMDRFWHLVWTNLTSYTFSFLFFFLSLSTFSQYMVCLSIQFYRVASN